MQATKQNSQVTLSDALILLVHYKWVITLPALLIGIVVAYFVFSMPNVYRAEAILAPNQNLNGTQAGGSSGLGGLAQLAGVSLGTPQIDKIDLALEVMKSKIFINEFIENHLDLPKLIASESWDKSSNTLVIDNSYYSVENSAWIESPFNKNDDVPKTLDIYKSFFDDTIKIKQDKSTSIITISAEHISPYYAKLILDEFINAINEKIKEQDVSEAEESILFLKQLLAETKVASLKKLIYELMSSNMQTIMLANTRAEYIFKTVDPAFVDTNKVGPKRTFIIVLSVFFTGSLLFLCVLFRYFWVKK